MCFSSPAHVCDCVYVHVLVVCVCWSFSHCAQITRYWSWRLHHWLILKLCWSYCFSSRVGPLRCMCACVCARERLNVFLFLMTKASVTLPPVNNCNLNQLEDIHDMHKHTHTNTNIHAYMKSHFCHCWGLSTDFIRANGNFYSLTLICTKPFYFYVIEITP